MTLSSTNTGPPSSLGIEQQDDRFRVAVGGMVCPLSHAFIQVSEKPSPYWSMTRA
jgi:hypothetical protein